MNALTSSYAQQLQACPELRRRGPAISHEYSFTKATKATVRISASVSFVALNSGDTILNSNTDGSLHLFRSQQLLTICGGNNGAITAKELSGRYP